MFFPTREKGRLKALESEMDAKYPFSSDCCALKSLLMPAVDTSASVDFVQMGHLRQQAAEPPERRTSPAFRVECCPHQRALELLLQAQPSILNVDFA